jgi:hypothetical protein
VKLSARNRPRGRVAAVESCAVMAEVEASMEVLIAGQGVGRGGRLCPRPPADLEKRSALRSAA